jgi:hypothetical protein
VDKIDVPPGGFKAASMTDFIDAMNRFSVAYSNFVKGWRLRSMGKKGISTGVAPGPFGDHVDISIPDRPPRL